MIDIKNAIMKVKNASDGLIINRTWPRISAFRTYQEKYP